MQKENSQKDQTTDPDLASVRSADITFEEQIEIIGEINEVLAKNRIEIKPDTFAFTAKKKGSLIPLLINGGALFILAAGAFFLLAFFNREERSLIRESATVLSAEGKLIAALREESEQQLSQKDRQIAEIRSRLEDLREQAETAKLDTEARIQEREDQLRAELEAQLEAERQKLRGEGLSSTAIDNQLRTLEQRLTAENESRLTTFRTQSEAELAERETEIAALEQQSRQSLLQFQQERTALQQQFSQREAELRAQLAAQAAEAQSAQAEVVDQLTRLREQRQREQLILDQILSSYNQVESSLQSGRYDAALRDLGNLESYLAQLPVASLPSVQNRIPTERFLIASLRSLIEVQRKATAEAESQGQESSGALSNLQTELDRTKASLSQQTREHSQTKATLDQRTRELNQAQATLTQRTRELNQAKATISQQSQQISRYEASQREITALRQEVSALRQRYSLLSSGGGPARVSQARVLALVDTKLQVREVLSAEPVKSKYPGLYEAMEDYFDTFGMVQLQSGQESALRDANAILDYLLGGGSANLSAMKRSYAAVEGDPFDQFLQKLEALLK
ncbi:MAG: hypothetical protein JSV89_08515 [Spirochaetaceae bacterium]|nr:MAG: hypothetical protein JSV89_08515 [Spirochaetaceae bacterium]